MIDVKKLITGFLVLAVAGGAAALLISNIGASAAANGTAIVATAATGQPAASVSGNAFLPQQADADQNSGDVAIADDPGAAADPNATPALVSSTEAMMNDPNNLTNILAQAYVNNLALTNPNGPQSEDGNGNPTLAAPDPNAVLAEFEGSSTPAGIVVPDWDTEVDQVPIVITSSSASALATYGSAVANILNEDVVQTNLQSMLNNNTDPSFEPYVFGQVQTALQDIAGLPTPAPAEALQKSLIKTLVYAKNMLALGEGASVDPLKTELIMGAENTKYQTAVQDLQTQAQAVQSKNLFSLASDPADDNQSANRPSQNKILADIQSLVGIPTAHAQLTVYDPINNVVLWANVAKLVENQLKDVALQLIKNSLVFIMQKTIFAAIKGSGAPAFIQQWGNTLANAFQASALNALNAQFSCVGAAPFAAQLKLTLGATYLPGNKNVCAVQFNSQLNNNLNNLSKFYNNFSSGGWVTYGSTLQPDNNYYGSAFFIAQTVGNTAQNAQNAAQAKAVASQGFHGSATCDDGSNPNAPYYNCSGGAGASFNTTSPSCPAGYQVTTLPADGVCADGSEPLVQTPGAVFNGMVGSAINGNFSLITSATSWEGLASGLFVSILQETLNSLAQSTISDANGLLQQAFSGGGANSVTSNSNGTYTATAATAPQPVYCYVEPALSGDPDQAQLNASGGEVLSTSSSTPVTTPSYTWVPQAGVLFSAPTGEAVIATFNATGTYQIEVDDTVDNVSGTCTVSIPEYTGNSTSTL